MAGQLADSLQLQGFGIRHGVQTQNTFPREPQPVAEHGRASGLAISANMQCLWAIFACVGLGAAPQSKALPNYPIFPGCQIGMVV